MAPPRTHVSIRWSDRSSTPPSSCEGSSSRSASRDGYATDEMIFIRPGVMQAAKNVRPPNCRPKMKIAVMSSGTSNMYPKVPTCTEGKMLCMTIPRP